MKRDVCLCKLRKTNEMKKKVQTEGGDGGGGGGEENEETNVQEVLLYRFLGLTDLSVNV